MPHSLVGEKERERRRWRCAAEPDEVIAAPFDLRLEMFLVFLADEAVDAVGRDDQIGVSEAIEISDLRSRNST